MEYSFTGERQLVHADYEENASVLLKGVAVITRIL